MADVQVSTRLATVTPTVTGDYGSFRLALSQMSQFTGADLVDWSLPNLFYNVKTGAASITDGVTTYSVSVGAYSLTDLITALNAAALAAGLASTWSYNNQTNRVSYNHAGVFSVTANSLANKVLGFEVASYAIATDTAINPPRVSPLNIGIYIPQFNSFIPSIVGSSPVTWIVPLNANVGEIAYAVVERTNKLHRVTVTQKINFLDVVLIDADTGERISLFEHWSFTIRFFE